ncbi:MAG: hypothetical protein KKA79_09435 [Nanoarchaeota archaeon]|nr:hypothetical protein [Nanoarchaeota archaeon]MCG2718335.1 hypothetical protein [Nanoarchaeota archaeon]
MFPKVKKKIKSFLLSEEGKISKQSLLSLGSFVSAAVVGGVLAAKDSAADHTNTVTVSFGGETATGTHVHHNVHASHAVHAVHASHASGDGGDCGACGDCGDCGACADTAPGLADVSADAGDGGGC